jgi:hypothetical protein
MVKPNISSLTSESEYSNTVWHELIEIKRGDAQQKYVL